MESMHGKKIPNFVIEKILDKIDLYNGTTIPNFINDLFDGIWIINSTEEVKNNLDQVMKEVQLYYNDFKELLNVSNYDTLIVICIKRFVVNLFTNLKCINCTENPYNINIDSILINSIKTELKEMLTQ